MICSRCHTRESNGLLLALCPDCLDWVEANLDWPDVAAVVIQAQDAVFAADGFAVVRDHTGKALGLRKRP